MLMGTVASAIPSGTLRNPDTAEEAANIIAESAVLPHPCGLQNLGNTCYLNSVIQMLKSSTEFASFLLE